MAVPGPDPDRADDPGTWVDRGATTRRPVRMQVLLIVIAIGVIGLLVVLHATGTIGPGAH